LRSSRTTKLPAANTVGWGHVGLAAALQTPSLYGGEELGKPAKTSVPGAGNLEVTYARDPEGNIIELQAWG
jgi:hypothetical protein